MSDQLNLALDCRELAIPGTILIVDGTRSPEVVKVIQSNLEGNTPQ